MYMRTENISCNSQALYGALFGYVVHTISMHMDKRVAGFTMTKGSLAHTVSCQHIKCYLK